MTSISKNMYIDKLDDIFNKYNKTCHSTIKMKPVDVKPNMYINSSKEINDKDPKFTKIIKIKITIKIYLQKAIFQIGLKKFLWLKKLKTLFRGHILLLLLRTKKV